MSGSKVIRGFIRFHLEGISSLDKLFKTCDLEFKAIGGFLALIWKVNLLRLFVQELRKFEVFYRLQFGEFYLVNLLILLDFLLALSALILKESFH